MDSLKARHKRVFSKTLFAGKNFIVRFFRKKPNNTFIPLEQAGESRSSSSSRFFRQLVSATVALLLLTSFSPGTLMETGLSAEFLPDSDGFDLDLPEESFMVTTDEGFFLKTNPQDEKVNRIGFTDKVQHTVAPGETLSLIAQRYGLKLQTLLWENNLSDGDFLKVGQTVIVPAVDGVSHTVKDNGETINKIAKIYSVESSAVIEHNHIENGLIRKGQVIFVPGGEKPKPPPPPARSAPARESVRTFVAKSPTIATNDAPKGNKPFIYPTDGDITQGYRGGHYAVDIGNRSKPDIWAAAGGKVITADGGCASREKGRNLSCNHGYGNHVIIDHGNGLQTTYAHMETIYVVLGQDVSQGQLIGKMGNTGRVYGATGIHLHFEVSDNGVKKNPAKYY